jgi:hypothetical protein
MIIHQVPPDPAAQEHIAKMDEERWGRYNI